RYRCLVRGVEVRRRGPRRRYRRRPRRRKSSPAAGSLTGRWAWLPAAAPECRGIEIQVGERNALEVGETKRLELTGERRRVADQHNRELIRLEELLGDP